MPSSGSGPRVSLVSVPFVKDYMRNARCDFVSLSNTQWYPILLGSAGTYLEAKGCQVQLIDGQCEETTVDDVFDRIRRFSPQCVVIYGGLKSQAADMVFGDRVQAELGCTVVYVGPYVAIEPFSWLRAERPRGFATVGEFELPVLGLLQGKAPAEIGNLCYLDAQGQAQRTAELPLLSGAELDAMPFVSGFFKKHLDLRRYKAPSEPFPFMDIMTGRGCGWGQCTYCLWVFTFVKGATYNTRSVDNVVEEFAFIRKELPEVRSIMIQDDTLMPPHAMALSEALIKARNRLPWSCYMRANCPKEVLVAMKKAGCLNLHVGYETSTPETLKLIRKGVTRERMERFTRDAKAAGLKIHGDFMIGFPGETEESLREMIRWSCNLRPDTAQYQIFLPYRGTPIYEEMKAQGWLTEAGEANYPHLSRGKLAALSRHGYRRFYISRPYLLECLRHPYERVFKRLDTYLAAIPAVFARDED